MGGPTADEEDIDDVGIEGVASLPPEGGGWLCSGKAAQYFSDEASHFFADGPWGVAQTTTPERPEARSRLLRDFQAQLFSQLASQRSAFVKPIVQAMSPFLIDLDTGPEVENLGDILYDQPNGQDGDDDFAQAPELHTERSRISSGIAVLSPHSLRPAVEDFSWRNQTIILLDWDDTLCASTACLDLLGAPSLSKPLPGGKLKNALAELAREARALIELALELAAKVVVVTNAVEGWVDLSCTAWMPELEQTLGLVDVTSARSKWEPCGIQSPTGWKAREFEVLIDGFYSQSDDEQWRNMVTVGDAPYEHDALRRVVASATGRRPRHGCSSKCMKFVHKPSFSELACELRTLRGSLEEIVHFEGDLYLSLG
eukprot:TRINITY_DN10896_c0_g1_i1.p1 TRINITY_DN10896_c0_g1~~TRINITY_DN10896_c0_g1_i1.p1  ORF type:complete len:371 (-),score=66.94 TRINITY_DN10896_c0_g1_i1:32-1144(-)